MSVAPDRSRGPVGVVSAVSGPSESAVAVALSGRRDVVLVRRCADVAELLSVAEVGLAAVAVLNEAFAGVDGDVVDRLRRAGLAVLGVVDPDRESSERLRAWAVPVVEVSAAPGRAEDGEGALVSAVVAAAGSRGTGRGAAAGAAPGPTDVPAGRRPADPADPVDPADRAGPGGGDDLAGPGRCRRPRRPGPSARRRATPRRTWPGATRRVPALRRAVSGPPVTGAPTTARRAADHRAGARPGPPAQAWTALLSVPGTGPAGGGAARGRVVAVWGPAGAPGRTTVAVGVAAELAAAGTEVLLVDADTYAASVAQVLGLLDESPGLVAAVRAGLDGRLDASVLARLAPVAAPRLRVLTGLTRSARWSELRPAGLQAVLAAGRTLVDVVVVDLAPPLEEDEELSYDTAAPRRNGAALDVLRAADEVVVVGSADPVGLQRLVRGLQDLLAVVPSAAPVVVVNRVRPDAVGRNPGLRVTEALERFAGVRVRHLVPDDRPATDRALLSGRTLLEQAPDSPARAALRTLAAALVPGGRARGRAGSPGPGRAARARRRATGG